MHSQAPLGYTADIAREPTNLDFPSLYDLFHCIVTGNVVLKLNSPIIAWSGMLGNCHRCALVGPENLRSRFNLRALPRGHHGALDQLRRSESRT